MRKCELKLKYLFGSDVTWWDQGRPASDVIYHFVVTPFYDDRYLDVLILAENRKSAAA